MKRNALHSVEVVGIPMIAQRKNYCAVATCERVMRYYGRDVDQHLLAKAANATTERGTMPADLMGALRGMGNELGVKVRVHHLDDAKDLKRHITDYNRLAKRSNDILFLDHTPQSQFYRQAKRPLLLQIRADRKVDRQKFVGNVTKYIDTGIPLLWTVMLNVVDEEPDPIVDDVTGHMRLITGYNKSKGYIIYSDTWGAAHERKALPLKDAWLITTGLFTLEPEGVRP